MPDLTSILILCVLTFAGGFVDSIAGGGGLITLPAYYAVGLPPHVAMGTNKLSAIFGSIVSTWRYVRGNAYYKANIIAAVAAALLGSGAGAQLALLVDERNLLILMIIAVPVLGVFMAFKKDFETPVLKNRLSERRLLFLTIVVSFIVGAYDGFLGPGTGTFLILANLYMLGLGLNASMGNAKIVNLSTGVAALAVFMVNGKVDYVMAIPASLSVMAGSYIGAGLALKNGKKIVRPVMLIVMALLVVKLIIDAINV